MRYLLILDAGHGLDTEGKRTPLFTDGTFMHENEFNRSVVRKIDALLEEYKDIDVVFTTTEKRDIDKDTKNLDERVRRANDVYNKYKNKYEKVVLVSIHANAIKSYWYNIANGTATFYYPTNMTDKAFAETIQKNLIANTKLKPHRDGVVGGNFQIIREVKMTACLCECAFMDNLEEAKLLLTDNFRQACAEGIVDGLKEYFDMNDKKVKVHYFKTKNKTYQLTGNPSDIGIKIVNQNNKKIEEPNCVNGTFFWHLINGDKYSTSILVKDGEILKNDANHLSSFGCPQNVFIVYNNGQVEMKKLKYATEIDYKNVKIAVGGVGLRDTTNPNFTYNPASEGFKKDINKLTGKVENQSGVLRKTNKTVVAYNKKENMIYLMCRPNIYHKSLWQYDLLTLVKDCDYDIALSLDGGGSTFMNNEKSMVLKGDGRKIHNVIGFNL